MFGRESWNERGKSSRDVIQVYLQLMHIMGKLLYFKIKLTKDDDDDDEYDLKKQIEICID